MRRSSPLRYSIGALVAVAVLAASACSTSTAGDPSTAGSSTGTKKLSSLLFVNPLPNYSQWKLIGQCMSAEAKTLGVPYTETGPTGVLNPVQMVQEIQTGITNKAGAIVTFPASPAFGPVLQQAHKAGIITGTMYGGGGTAPANFNAGVDWNALGRQYVAALACCPGIQRVGLLAVSPTGVGKAFVYGFKAAAAGNPNIKVEAIIYTNDDPATTLSETNALLSRTRTSTCWLRTGHVDNAGHFCDQGQGRCRQGRTARERRERRRLPGCPAGIRLPICYRTSAQWATKR